MGDRLAGQVAFVTGGASGMGRATAERFAREGACVAIADVQATLGLEVVDAIANEGGSAIYLQCDVSDEQAVASAIDQTVGHFGQLNTLVNVAGIARFKTFHEFTSKDWDEIMGVNLKGMFHTCRLAIPHLLRHERSYIVNVGSISCFIGDMGESIYSAAKGGVLMLTKSIALEYAAAGLRCNCICPGITDTPMLRYHLETTPDPEATLAARLRRVPMGVAVQPDDIARTAVYLACEDSACVTGTSILVDGGYLAAAEWTSPETTAFMQQVRVTS